MIVIIQAQLRLWPNTSGLGKGQCKVCKVCLAGKAVKAGELSVDLLWLKVGFKPTVCRFKFYFSKHHPHFVILPNQTDWLSEIWFLILIKTAPYNWVVPTQIKADERPRARHEMKPTTTHPSNYHPSIFIKNKHPKSPPQVRDCLPLLLPSVSRQTWPQLLPQV